MTGSIASAAIGSAHHQPKAAEQEGSGCDDQDE
jgi:hypothetical protein